jgi:hypothetical protein
VHHPTGHSLAAHSGHGSGTEVTPLARRESDCTMAGIDWTSSVTACRPDGSEIAENKPQGGPEGHPTQPL